MISKYFDFRTLALLESILMVDPAFADMIRHLSEKDDVAYALSSLFNKDITTNLNYIKMSGANDELTFINDGQATRFKEAGENPFTKKGNVSKIGRAVRQILAANSTTKFSDKEIETFVNRYKATWDMRFNPSSRLSFVSGDDIRKWYNEKVYESGRGTLNNSCMRYSNCQEYFGIYTKNPKSVRMAIYLNEDNMLKGRALVWNLFECEWDYYIDRIYSKADSDRGLILDWIKGQLKDSKVVYREDMSSANFKNTKVKVDNIHYEKYPYMDSLLYYYPDSGLLYGDIPRGVDERELVLTLRNTDGGFVTSNHVWSKHANRFIYHSDGFYGPDNDFYPSSEGVLLYNGEMVMKDTATYSELYKGYILSNGCVETEWGLTPKDDIYNVEVGNGTKKMPGIFRDKTFYVAVSPRGLSKYGILKELAFKDITGRVYLSANKETLVDRDLYEIYRIKSISGGRYQGSLIEGREEYHNAFGYYHRMFETKDRPMSLPIAIKWNNSTFGIKSDIEMVSGTSSTITLNENVEYISRTLFMQLLYPANRLSYDAQINAVDNSGISDEMKNKRKEFLTSIHVNLMERDSSYMFRYYKTKYPGSNSPAIFNEYLINYIKTNKLSIGTSSVTLIDLMKFDPSVLSPESGLLSLFSDYGGFGYSYSRKFTWPQFCEILQKNSNMIWKFFYYMITVANGQVGDAGYYLGEDGVRSSTCDYIKFLFSGGRYGKISGSLRDFVFGFIDKVSVDTNIRNRATPEDMERRARLVLSFQNSKGGYRGAFANFKEKLEKEVNI